MQRRGPNNVLFVLYLSAICAIQDLQSAAANDDRLPLLMLKWLVGHEGLATLLCAVLVFLSTADRFFALRVHGINARVADVMLAVGLVTWLVARKADVKASFSSLATAWAPFVAVYAVAAVTSATPGLGLLKLAWFAFNMLTAFAWCRLFDARALARGLCAAFLVVSAIIVVDFATGFTRGPEHMIGYGQPNDLVPGQILYRPHAFYYEPSYAASGVSLAWALALTPLGAAAGALSTMLLGVGLAAVVATLSRTGWLYVGVVCVALLAFGAAGGSAFRIGWRKALLALAVATLICLALAASAGSRTQLATLLHTLGWQQTVERVCPIVRDRVGFLDLQCQSGEERRRSMSRLRDVVPKDTGEGQRLTSLENAIALVKADPLLGSGVTPGEHRLLESRASNVWLELAIEGGVLSVVAFAWGLGYALYRWRVFRPENGAIAIVLVAYFGVAWQFLQTFPRLDQWLTFWIALAFALQRSTGAEPAAHVRLPP